MKYIAAAKFKETWRPPLDRSRLECSTLTRTCCSTRLPARWLVWPLTREVAHVTTQLDVKGDPADQIIAATSVVYQVPLVTRDKVIRRSKRVPFPS